MLISDFFFLIDRIFDLFVGFVNKEGENEGNLKNVINKNFSSGFYLEAFYAISPFFLLDVNGPKSMAYFLIKIPRFNRLFDMDQATQCFIDFYGKKWTVFEI